MSYLFSFYLMSWILSVMSIMVRNIWIFCKPYFIRNHFFRLNDKLLFSDATTHVFSLLNVLFYGKAAAIAVIDVSGLKNYFANSLLKWFNRGGIYCRYQNFINIASLKIRQ